METLPHITLVRAALIVAEENAGKLSRLTEAKQENKETENLRERIVKHHDEILTW